MPFSVTQVNKVQFELVEPVSADDFLKLILENGETLYVSLEDDQRILYGILYKPYFRFDPEFLPVSLKAQIDGYVNQWVSEGFSRTRSMRNVQEKITELRTQKKSILRWYANQIYHSLRYVQGTSVFDRTMNIGAWVSVEHYRINPDGGDLLPPSQENSYTYWCASAPIAAILPITRDEIRLELDNK